MKQGPDPRPKPPRTNCFHLRPTFLDNALTNRVVDKKRQLTMKSNGRKREAQKTGTGWSFDHLLGTLGPLFCLNTLECVRACRDVACIMVTQYSSRTCETRPFFFLRKATPAQPAPVSRHIPFPGDSGGGERAKCITLLVSFFMPSLKRAQCFLSSLKWVKTTVLRSFPAEGNGVSVQRLKV